MTNIYPGEVDTPILENRPSPVSDEHRARILQPEDFANITVAIAALPPRRERAGNHRQTDVAGVRVT